MKNVKMKIVATIGFVLCLFFSTQTIAAENPLLTAGKTALKQKKFKTAYNFFVEYKKTHQAGFSKHEREYDKFYKDVNRAINFCRNYPADPDPATTTTEDFELSEATAAAAEFKWDDSVKEPND
jgi:hypothetical protein